MAQAYSVDLRKRVIDAISGGLSTREAARRFCIGQSTAGAWYRSFRDRGKLEPDRQGKPKGSKLDAHENFILTLAEREGRDISLKEIADLLESERGIKTCKATVHDFFKRRDITFKKNGACQ